MEGGGGGAMGGGGEIPIVLTLPLSFSPPMFPPTPMIPPAPIPNGSEDGMDGMSGLLFALSKAATRLLLAVTVGIVRAMVAASRVGMSSSSADILLEILPACIIGFLC